MQVQSYMTEGTEDEWADRCVSDPFWLGQCLQRIGRFGGQHPTANVLTHSLDVCGRMALYPAQYRLWALYHDAHEVLSGDIPRRAKHLLSSDFNVWVETLDIKLAYRLGVDLQRVWRAVAKHDTASGDLEYMDFLLHGGIPAYLGIGCGPEDFERLAFTLIGKVANEEGDSDE